MISISFGEAQDSGFFEGPFGLYHFKWKVPVFLPVLLWFPEVCLTDVHSQSIYGP